MKWKDIVRGPLTQSCEGFKSVSLSTHYNGNIEYLLLTFILQTKVLFFASFDILEIEGVDPQSPKYVNVI